jgi:hypothetical protein
MIWKHALPGPRVVPLTIDDSFTIPCPSSNELIVIRLACHEALKVVLENYEKYVPVSGSIAASKTIKDASPLSTSITTSTPSFSTDGRDFRSFRWDV